MNLAPVIIMLGIVAEVAGRPALDLTGELFTLLGILLVAVLGWVGTIIVRRVRGNRATEPEMWRRLDELSLTVYGGRDKEGHEVPGLQRELADTRVALASVQDIAAAQGRIITAVVKQSPEGFVPRLNPADLEKVDEHTIPSDSPWRVKP